MTRRRLVLAVCVAVVALGAAWWLSIDRLSPEEQLLVGTWIYHDTVSGRHARMQLLSDRRYSCAALGGAKAASAPLGRWCVREGNLLVDLEDSPIRRALRPVAGRVGLAVADIGIFQITAVSAEEIVITLPGGTRQTWNRGGF